MHWNSLEIITIYQECYRHADAFLKEAKPAEKKLKFIDFSSYKGLNALRAV